MRLCAMLPSMQKFPIHVLAEWDIEASVWVGTTDDIYGFGIEDADLDRLVKRVPGMLADLLEENNVQLPAGVTDVPFEVHVSPAGFASARIA